jgi:DNA-binding GntR family transcriptional regulator
MIREPSLSPASGTEADRIADALRMEITTGALGPGVRIRQRDVAVRFGASTTPVREALATLEREGLLRIEPHKGARVRALSEGELRDHYEIRIAVEALAARDAARYCTRDAARRLQALLDEMRGESDPERYLALNQRFHAELYELGGNRQLCSLIASLRDQDSVYLKLYAARQVPSARLDREHQRILDRCAANDPDGCERALRAHLAGTIEHVSRLLRQARVS